MKPKKKRFLRQSGLFFKCVVKKLNGGVISKLSPKKTTIARFLQANSAAYARIYICVTYKPGLINEGEYTLDQKSELMNAWNSFTEEDLIRDVINY